MKSLLDSIVSNGGITDYSTAGKDLVSFELVNLMESNRQRSVPDLGKGRGEKGMRMLTILVRILDFANRGVIGAYNGADFLIFSPPPSLFLLSSQTSFHLNYLNLFIVSEYFTNVCMLVVVRHWRERFFSGIPTDMAPRARPKKVGLKRIDAAVDALRPLGFSKDIVHKTVNALLKVYDGNWVFIEEGSYKLLIETILEEQEKTGGITVKDETCAIESEEQKITEPFAAEHAKEVTRVGETSTAHGVMGLLTETGLQEDISTRDADSAGHGLRLERINRIRPTAILESTQVRRGSETVPSHVQPLATPVVRRRKPCYGWISDDDEDEEEDTKTGLVVREKAGTKQCMDMFDLGKGGKRKARWDVKPEDM